MGAIAFACAPSEPEDDGDGDALEIETTGSGLCNVATPCNAVPNLAMSTIPATMNPGEKQYRFAVMTNTGAGSWNTTSILLNSQNTPSTFWGTPYERVDPTIITGQNSIHPILLKAPVQPGTYPFRYRMRDQSAVYFGTQFNTNIVVQPQQSEWACTNTGPLPTRLTAGRTTPVTFTVTNSGFDTWEGTSGLFRLCQMDSLQWGSLVCRNLTTGDVPPGGTASFTFNLIAPAAPGNYPLRRQMRDAHTLGIQLFDDDVADSCVNTTVEVTLCGNGTINAGEVCDDNNLSNGDGCDSQCMPESVGVGRVVDLATDPADVTLEGSLLNRQLGNVVIAQLIGSAARDVIVGEIADVAPASGPTRATAGRVTVYNGAGFLAGSDATVPAGAAFSVIGADAGDHLGATYNGRIVVGDVTGDGTPDLILSAPHADGPMNTRTDCGEIYVLVGGTTGTTTIDLRSAPAGVLGATIYGSEAGAGALILGVGNFGGDLADDLVIGVPGADNTNGADAGSVFILYGGATFATGTTIDLATATPDAIILGPTAGEFFGSIAAIGDVIGGSPVDLAVSSPNHTALGRASAGSAWVIRGPISGTRNLLTQFDTQIIGQGANDDLGTSLAIGNVNGDTRSDLVIGIRQQHSGAPRVGAVDIWTGPIATGTRDLGSGATANARILGIDADDNTGASIALGNYNNDGGGYLDLAIAAAQADGSSNTVDRAGEISVVLGASNLTGTRNLSMIGNGVLKVFGASTPGSLGAHPLSVAMGDINGDGRADVCAGAYRGGSVGGGRIDCFQAQ